MNLVDQFGKPVALSDLNADDALAVMNFSAGIQRGWREAIAAVTKAIVEGRVPGLTFGDPPAKAVPLTPQSIDVAAQPITINLTQPDVIVNLDNVAITSMPDRLTRRVVTRDARGVITESTDVEVDA